MTLDADAGIRGYRPGLVGGTGGHRVDGVRRNGNQVWRWARTWFRGQRRNPSGYPDAINAAPLRRDDLPGLDRSMNDRYGHRRAC